MVVQFFGAYFHAVADGEGASWLNSQSSYCSGKPIARNVEGSGKNLTRSASLCRESAVHPPHTVRSDVDRSIDPVHLSHTPSVSCDSWGHGDIHAAGSLVADGSARHINLDIPESKNVQSVAQTVGGFIAGPLVSGDSGWLSTAELAWTFWQNPHHSLQLVPFVGAGGIRTSIPGGRITDTVGSGGVLVRWQAQPAWVVEMGWVDQFSTEDKEGPWSDWALGQGFYGRVQYRF